jgi:hypothetical protein
MDVICSVVMFFFFLKKVKKNEWEERWLIFHYRSLAFTRKEERKRKGLKE